MEYLYIVQLREHRKTGECVYKVGRTSRTVEKRLVGYPKGSIVKKVVECYHSVRCEKVLLEVCKERFVWASEYGAEYFAGSLVEISKALDEVVKKEREEMGRYLRPPPVQRVDTNPLTRGLSCVGNWRQFEYKG